MRASAKPANRPAFRTALLAALAQAGYPLPASGQYSQLGVGVAAEDLNATLTYLQDPGFQAWKSLVNLLRFIKAAKEGRAY